MPLKYLPVNLIGDESSMYIHAATHEFYVALDGHKYVGLIHKGKKADGNSTPFFLHWMLKPNGPHVDTGNIHDSLYENPVVHSVATGLPRRLTRMECDKIHFYFLRHDTGLLPLTFKSNPSLLTKLKHWVQFKKAPKFVIKDRVCNMVTARIAFGALIVFGWVAWRSWRKKDHLNGSNLQVPT